MAAISGDQEFRIQIDDEDLIGRAPPTIIGNAAKLSAISFAVLVTLVTSYINTNGGSEMVSSTHFPPIHIFILSLVVVFAFSRAAVTSHDICSSAVKWFETAVSISYASAFASLACMLLPSGFWWVSYASCTIVGLPFLLKFCLHCVHCWIPNRTNSDGPGVVDCEREGSNASERRRNLGLEVGEAAASRPPPPQVQEKKASLPVRPARKAELMRDCLRSLKQNHKDEDAKVKRAFQTLLTYVGNIAKNPDEEKFRKIRVNNQSFQDRVGSLHGGIQFLELCGFEKLEGDQEFLFLSRDKVDIAVLNSAGWELNSAITNPFFGLL